MDDNIEDRMECSDEGDSDSEDNENNEDGDVYIPGQQKEASDKLVCDESAYILYQRAQTGERY